MSLLLAIDIGNTSIHSGVFENMRLCDEFRILTHSGDMEQRYTKRLKRYLGNIERVVVVSVVPPVLSKIEKVLKTCFIKNILVVGRDVQSGIKNRYRDPGQVGQDRLVNARAAYELYGGEAIVVDFGTAITIDVVNKNREYLGGVIAPGVEISVNALSEKAYLLPDIEVRKPGGVLGKETAQSMVSGAVYGFSSLCDGIVRRLKKRYCRNGRVIATGGMSPVIGPYCETVDKIVPELTLRGLNLIGSNI